MLPLFLNASWMELEGIVYEEQQYFASAFPFLGCLVRRISSLWSPGYLSGIYGYNKITHQRHFMNTVRNTQSTIPYTAM